MHSKTEPLSEDALEAYEADRDLAADVLQAVREMKAGAGRLAWPPALAARQQTGLSQAQFADLLGVSVDTIEAWEHGRAQPTGAARTLLAVARRHPKVIQDVAADMASHR
ncbi:transcriptional regulator [Thiohalocapsa halophila]|uniref:Transcriptional regulator n=1 Tax=Thiohalocapsa halophila TaxID=69359 RepID=A0ABS1CG50_9GAMM|nr:transcriptional regulator [Thiohalocapsa halophila]